MFIFWTCLNIICLQQFHLLTLFDESQPLTAADVDVLRCIGSFNESTWPTQTLRKPTWTESENKKNKKRKSETHWKRTLRILCLNRSHMGSWVRLITLQKKMETVSEKLVFIRFEIFHRVCTTSWTNWDAPYLPDSSLVGRSGCCQCVCEPWPSTVQHIVVTVPFCSRSSGEGSSFKILAALVLPSDLDD